MENLKPNVSISSLSEYIDVVKKYNLNGNYFRGENDDFPSITSSLLRDYTPSNKTYGLIDTYTLLLREYYNEVGSELNNLQSENFLAFSQHHGLKTNLIDFTTSPVVALYFACDKKEYNKNSGYIYVLNCIETVDASDFLVKYSFNGFKYRNFLPIIAHQNKKVIDDFYYIIESYAGLDKEKAPNDLLFPFREQIINNPQLLKSNDFLFHREELRKCGLDIFLDGYNKLINEYLPELNVINKTTLLCEYLTLLCLYLQDIHSLFSGEGKIDSTIPFPTMPYLIYKTPLKFDRIRNQNGVFIYQPFIDYQTDFEEIGGLSYQKIIPSFIIEVKQQQKVMNELDTLGINKRFIYGDFDNSAQYVNRKMFN